MRKGSRDVFLSNIVRVPLRNDRDSAAFRRLLRARGRVGKAVAIDQRMGMFGRIMGSVSMQYLVMLVLWAHFRALRILVAHCSVTIVPISLPILIPFKR